jgi:hypothetical protein
MRLTQYSNCNQQQTKLGNVLERLTASIIPDDFCGTLMSGHAADWSYVTPASNQWQRIQTYSE